VGQILAILKVLGGLMISRDREVAGLVKSTSIEPLT
jgi:hypothetical protein